MKKVLSLLIAALFAVSLSVATFADDKPASGKEAAKTTEGKKKSKKAKKSSHEKKGEATSSTQK
jgi:hypothetical protein